MFVIYTNLLQVVMKTTSNHELLHLCCTLTSRLMITFKLTIRKEKMKADRTWTVFIQVVYKRERKFIRTSMSVSKKDLTASYKIKNRQVLDRGDDLIREYRRKADMLNLELNDMDIGEVVGFITRRQENAGLNFMKYAEKWMDAAEIKGVRNYRSAINALKGYFNKDNVLFSDITVNSMRAFEKSLADRPRAQSLYTNCIVKIFNDGRDYYNDEDNDVIRIRHSLRKYAAPRQNTARKRALPAADIIRIISLPYLDAPTRKGLPCRRDMAKDCFIMSFCLMGMNSVDMYNAKDFDGETLTYERAKTRDRRSDNALIAVRVHPFVRNLIEKYRGKDYLFTFRKRYSSAADFNRALNIGLKDIGRELGIDNLQFYCARHSMATIAVNDVGISKYVVNDMLNHVEPSMRVTDLYIRKDFTAVNEANRRLIDYIVSLLP